MRIILGLALYPAIKISAKESAIFQNKMMYSMNKNLLANKAGGEGLYRDPMEVLGKYLWFLIF